MEDEAWDARQDDSATVLLWLAMFALGPGFKLGPVEKPFSEKSRAGAVSLGRGRGGL